MSVFGHNIGEAAAAFFTSPVVEAGFELGRFFQSWLP